MQATALPVVGAFPAPAFPPVDDGPSCTPDSSRPQPEVPPAPVPSSWTQALLAPTDDVSLRREAIRFGIGAGLAGVYGLALGVRGGGGALLTHALGVPAAPLAALGLGVPALYIGLALFDAPLALSAVVSAASRASAAAGLVLAGLAPAAALFVVTANRPGAAALAAVAGLALGGAIGAGRLIQELRRGMSAARPSARAALGFSLVGFAVFAVAVAARIWWSTLPILRGVQ